MTYLELTPYLKGDKFYENNKQKKVVQRLATSSEFDRFCWVLSCNKRYLSMIEVSSTPYSFFNAAKDVASLFPKEIYDDLYFGVKNGSRYDGVPSKLLYLILKSKDIYKYPNLAMSMIKRDTLLQFCEKNVLGDGITILDVIQNVWKAEVLLLSSRRVKAIYKNVYEAYVPTFVGADGSTVEGTFDQVALIHEKIIERLPSAMDWRDLWYNGVEGLICNDMPLNDYTGNYNIVKDDLNLSEVY